MLEDIREKKTGLTTYILVGMAGIGMLFIGVPFFSASQNVSVAEVNGQDITYPQLQQAISNLRSNAPDLSLQQVESEAMRQLIGQTLLAEHAANSGFQYPEAELYQLLKSRFSDDTQYRQYLAQIGMDVAGYERLLRRDMTTQQYYNILARSRVTQPIIANAFTNNLTQHRAFTIVRLPIAPVLTQTEVSDADIEAYYNEHKETLMQPSEVAINYILFNVADLADPSAVTEQQLIEARNKLAHETSKRDGQYLIFTKKNAAEQAHRELLDGTPMTTIITTIDDGTVDGEHGQFKLHKQGDGPSQMADDALFALEQSGDISSVIDTDFGYMIVIAGNIDQGNIPDEQTLRAQIADEAAQARYHELTNQAFDAAQDGTNIAQIAAILGAKVEKTALFSAADAPESWLNEPDVSEQLFGTNAIAAGAMGQPVALSDDQSLFFSIEERLAEQLPSLEDIEQKVRDLASHARAEATLREHADQLAIDWNAAEPPEHLLTEYEATLQQVDLDPTNPIDGTAKNGLSLENQAQLFAQATRIATLTADNGDILVSRLDSVSNNAEVDPQLRTFLTSQWQEQTALLSYQGILKWLTGKADIRITYDSEL